MWKLNKPSLQKAVGKDINKLTTHCNALADADKPSLKSLYKTYDEEGGTISDIQLSQIPNAKAEAIHGQYSKTYAGETLNYIRAELFEDIDLCPYCSINQVSELDHYMPRSKYHALAVCRMNLVPLCGVCNHKKGDKNYGQFTHAYYEVFPSVPFLIANIYIRKMRFVTKYHFDSGAINNNTLEEKLSRQAQETELWDRLKKATNSFINDLCRSCDFNDTPSLIIWLNSRLKNYEADFGINDWRCAVIRGILNCNNLDINVINNYKANPLRVNRGAGA